MCIYSCGVLRATYVCKCSCGVLRATYVCKCSCGVLRATYAAIVTAVLVFLAVDVINDMRRLTSVCGMLLLIFLVFITSKNPSRVRLIVLLSPSLLPSSSSLLLLDTSVYLLLLRHPPVGHRRHLIIIIVGKVTYSLFIVIVKLYSTH